MFNLFRRPPAPSQNSKNPIEVFFFSITPASTPNVLIGFQEASKEVSKRLPKRFPRGLGTNWFLGFKKLPEASRRLPRGFKRLQEASRCIILLS